MVVGLFDFDTAGVWLIGSLMASPLICAVGALILLENGQVSASIRAGFGFIVGVRTLGFEFELMEQLAANEVQFWQLLLLPLALDAFRSIVENDATSARSASAWWSAAGVWAVVAFLIYAVADGLDADTDQVFNTEWILALKVIAGIEAATALGFAARAIATMRSEHSAGA